MTKRSPKTKPEKADPPTPRQPTEAERQAIAEAQERQGKRRERVRISSTVESGVCKVGPPHADGHGWGDAISDAYGSRSQAFVEAAMMQVDAVVRSPGASIATEKQVNAALAVMGAIQPQNELEAIMAAQMIAVHELAMDSAAKAKHATHRDARTAYTTDAVKLTRTFAAQMEALSKHRAGGKQQVEVRYVYVDARGSQNVIGAHTGGGGDGNQHQPHAPALTHAAAAPGLPVWCADALGDAVPFAGGGGEAALQDAWREEPGRAQGRTERELPPRPALDLVHGGAARSARARARSTGGAR